MKASERRRRHLLAQLKKLGFSCWREGGDGDDFAMLGVMLIDLHALFRLKPDAPRRAHAIRSMLGLRDIADEILAASSSGNVIDLAAERERRRSR